MESHFKKVIKDSAAAGTGGASSSSSGSFSFSSSSSSSSSSSCLSVRPQPVPEADNFESDADYSKAKKARKHSEKTPLRKVDLDNAAPHVTRGASAAENEDDSDYVQKDGKVYRDLSSDSDSSGDDPDFVMIDDDLEGSVAVRAMPEHHQTLPNTHKMDKSRVVRSGAYVADGGRVMTNTNPSDPKSVTPTQRVNDPRFAGNYLTISAGKLFCGACCSELALKSNSLNKHFAGAEHTRKVAILDARGRRDAPDRTILSFCKKQDADRKATGESFTTKPNVQAERMEVTYGMLEDVVSFEALNGNSSTGIRSLLEICRGKLPYRELRDLIPSIVELLRGLLKEGLSHAKALAVIFDGTPNVAEVFGIVVRYIDKNNKLQQKVLALNFYEKGFTANDLTAVIMDVLIVQWKFPRDYIRFFMCDGCPVNAAGLSDIYPMCKSSAQIICMSHSANVVGKTIWQCLPLAKEFQETWGSMVTLSFRARQIFKAVAKVATRTSCEVRWYNGWEIGKQVFEHSLAVNTVVHHDEDFAASSRQRLKDMLANDLDTLRIELGLLTDCGVELVKLCYFQEGDRMFLCVTTYDHWMSVLGHLNLIANVRTSVQRLRQLLPKTTSVIDTLQVTNIQKNQAITQAAQKLVPVYDKMQGDTIGRLRSTLAIFRACRLFGFLFVGGSNVTEDALGEELVHLLGLAKCNEMGEELFREELKEYRRLAVAAANVVVARRAQHAALVAAAQAAGVEEPEEDNKVDMSNEEFWNTNALNLPMWYKASREVALISPSSAACERLFSLMTNGFSAQQRVALSDYVLASCMLRFNKEVIT